MKQDGLREDRRVQAGDHVGKQRATKLRILQFAIPVRFEKIVRPASRLEAAGIY